MKTHRTCLGVAKQDIRSLLVMWQVKVYDVKDYGVIHSMKYSAPILSMALSPTDSHLVVGMVCEVLQCMRSRLL